MNVQAKDFIEDKDTKYSVPLKSGIYEIRCWNETHTDFMLLYVGQSMKLRSRLTSHLYPDNTDKCIKDMWEKYCNDTMESMDAKIKRYGLYSFIQDNLDRIELWYMEVPVEWLNAMEEFWIISRKPVFNYAGINRDFIPAKHQDDYNNIIPDKRFDKEHCILEYEAFGEVDFSDLYIHYINETYADLLEKTL